MGRRPFHGRGPSGRRPFRIRGLGVNAHALAVLEFRRALALVGARAASALGREAVEARVPATDAGEVRRELRRVTETQIFLSDRPGWGMPDVPDARHALERLALDGNVLEPIELFALGVLLASARALGQELEAPSGRYPALEPVRALLHEDEGAEEAIVRAVDHEGLVLDTASKELKRIRGELRRAHSKIVAKLEQYARSLPERIGVPDASVTIREGRYVVPIRREGKGEVGGIVLDESATGSTVFVEPPIAAQLMAELRGLEREEQREIRRVLGALTDRLAPVRDELAGSLDALVDFDSLHARARAALEWRAEAPEILEPGSDALVIYEGRHPLLLARAAAGGGDVVPFDLTLDPGERALVVSGPNTGGKSVFLKAIGMIAALTQAGVVPPVRKGTRLPLFRDLFADIGDEQSIAGSLSTFSAHLENLKEIVAGADHACLVLIDEMGTGTDPAEGAALARAILEDLVARGALCVVTSHLGALKTLDQDGSGIVNASLQFDPDRMEPTYRLIKGRPGRSYGLAIARRLGLPAGLLDHAEGYLSAGEVSVEDLLETLERREKETRELVASLDLEHAEVERLKGELEAREGELKRRERTAEKRAREEARQMLMEARSEVEEAIKQVRAAGDERELEDASRRARARVEDAAREQRERRERADLAADATELSPGQRVRLPGGALGAVVELKDGRALIQVGALRMEL
ncbi:MAG: hypothetical protein EXR95_04780, partial [Gemmatimonadetes bacterium]|nr:hypothetical protein [Gemmatimonadota bacterium]